VSLKVLRLFKCREIEGVWWLAADMRLRCYDGRWAGFAIYGLIMAALYIVGLPAAVLWILWRRRHKLFGSPTDPFVASTRATFGFLYDDYGSSAWWWEVEELARKLLLSAVVVLIDEGSPLQVTLAVLVSGWAHVLHAMYKPWGAGSVLYSLQHGALFVTSFVFLMGLLFKVDGVSSSSGTYTALSGIMVTLCVLFMAAWVVVIGARVVSLWRVSRHGSNSGSGHQTARDSRGAVGAGVVTKRVGGVVQSDVDGGTAAHSGGRAVDRADDVADTTVSASTSGDFVVTNPMRQLHRGPTGAVVVDDAAVSMGASALPPHQLLESQTTSSGMVSRPQRVLAAHCPVLATRGDRFPVGGSDEGVSGAGSGAGK
jgi:hypothetical protein